MATIKRKTTTKRRKRCQNGSRRVKGRCTPTRKRYLGGNKTESDLNDIQTQLQELINLIETNKKNIFDYEKYKYKKIIKQIINDYKEKFKIEIEEGGIDTKKIKELIEQRLKIKQKEKQEKEQKKQKLINNLIYELNAFKNNIDFIKEKIKENPNNEKELLHNYYHIFKKIENTIDKLTND